MTLHGWAALLGFTSLGAGLWLAWPPLCPIVLGTLLLTSAIVGYLRSPAPTKEATEEHA